MCIQGNEWKGGNIPAMRNLPGGLLTWNTNNVASSKLSLKIYFVARHQRLPKVTKLSWEYQAFWDNGTGAKWMAYQRWQKLIKFTHKVANAAWAMQMRLWNFSKAHFRPIYGRSVVRSQRISQTAHDTPTALIIRRANNEKGN